jgi:acyl carrier protein
MNSLGVQQAIAQSLRALGCDVADVLPIQELHGDFGVDSTEMIELVAILRTDFGFALEPIDIRGVKTVGDLIARVEARASSVGAR